jgi:uncharacterized coiled-coil protein SlyX
LSKLNWHPVVELEIRSIVREKRMQQLESEILQVERETEQLKSENARLAELNAKIAALWPSSTSNSIQDRPPASDLQT